MATALGEHADLAGPGQLFGLEQEYGLSHDSESLDFRDLIHQIGVEGRRLDPGDTNAYRCVTGMALTCDDEEAEVASPPVRVRPGFTDVVEYWAAEGRAYLRGLLPTGVAINGYSTHLNAAVPETNALRLARLHARLFASALMLMIDGPTSHGVFVRPRPGRLELCGEYVAGERLRAASVFFAGSVRACAAAIGGCSVGCLPPELAVELSPAVGRYGLYVGRRRAFGFDLYEGGRKAVLPLAGGGTIGCQEHLELAWYSARAALGADVGDGDVAGAERIISANAPLGIEVEGIQAEGCAPRVAAPGGERKPPPASPFGQVLGRRRRPGFEVISEMATWQFTIFGLRSRTRRVYVCIPSSHLSQFLTKLDSGELDGVLTQALCAEPVSRVLLSHAQTREPDVWEGVGPATGLLPPERDATGQPTVLGAGTSPGERPGKRGRRGKLAIPAEARSSSDGDVEASASTALSSSPSHVSWRPAVIALLVAAVVGAVAIAAIALAADPPGPRKHNVTNPAVFSSTTSMSPVGPGPNTEVPTPSTVGLPSSTSSSVPPTTRVNAATSSLPAVSEPSTSIPPAVTTTATAPVGAIQVVDGCRFNPSSLNRPTGSSVTFVNQTGVTVSIFINAPPTGTDVTLSVGAGAESSAYMLSVSGTYFLECSGAGGGGMQISASG